MLELIIRDWGRQARHAARRRSITIQDALGASTSGFITALGDDSFSFEGVDGRMQQIPYRWVAAVSFD